MQKPEPRTQLWSGFAALARPGQALLPHILSHAEHWPPYPHPAQLSKASANTLSKALYSPLSGEKDVGQSRSSGGNLVAQHPADFYSPESTILVLKWVSQHHLLLHVIPLAFCQRVKKLLSYIQCESEVNRFFSREEIMLGWGGAEEGSCMCPRAATGH